MSVKPKKRGFGLEMRVFEGNSGQTYIVFRTREGAYHAFQEVDAKDAATDCGTRGKGNTRQMWKAVWEYR